MKAFANDVKNIAWICKPFWRWGKIYIILSLFILGLYSPIDDLIYVRFPEINLDLLTRGEAFLHIAGIATLICGISFLNNTVRKLSRAYFTKKQAEISLHANQEIYRKAVELDYQYIDNPAFYDNYAWAVKEYAIQMEKGRELLVSFSQCILSLVALVTLISALGPWILLIEVIQMVLHTLVNSKVNSYVIRQKEATVSLERRLDYFHRLFYMKDYAADMKSTPLSNYILGENLKVGIQNVNVLTSYSWKIEFWNIVHEVIFCLTELGIVLYLVQSIVSGRIPEIGMYMTLMLAFYRLDSKMDTLTYLVKDASMLSMNVDKIKAFFEMKSRIEAVGSSEKEIPDSEEFSVELRDVGFSYANSEFSLSGLNLSINPGEKVAIVGENGVGKSTFLKLLLRLYDVSEGEILIDGKPIQSYDVHLLRQRIGVAFQNTNVYAMSFTDNISLYRKMTDQVLNETVKKLGLDLVLEKKQD